MSKAETAYQTSDAKAFGGAGLDIGGGFPTPLRGAEAHSEGRIQRNTYRRVQSTWAEPKK